MPPARTHCAAQPAGFTLLELVVTLVVAVLVATLAVPGFTALSRGLALDGTRDRLYGDLLFARNHAVTHGLQVRLCPRRGDTCGDVDDWSNGWLVYEHNDTDNRRDPRPAPGDTILLTHRGEPDRVTLRFHARYAYFWYNNTGIGWPGGTFRICTAGSDDPGVALILYGNGSARFPRPSDPAVECPR